MSPGTYSEGGTCGLCSHLLADLPQDGGLERHGLEERPHHAALLPGLQLAQLLYADSSAWAQGPELRAHRCPPPQGTDAGLTGHGSSAALSLPKGETTEDMDPLDLKDPLAPGGQGHLGCGWALDGSF